jgi:hypothetical protein
VWDRCQATRVRRCKRYSPSCLSPWSWALIEKTPVAQLLKNFPTFCGTRRFITVFIRPPHWSLSWAKINHTTDTTRSRDSSVGTVTGYGLDGRSSIPGVARFFSSPQRPNRLWGPHSLLSDGYRGLFMVFMAGCMEDMTFPLCVHFIFILYIHNARDLV